MSIIYDALQKTQRNRAAIRDLYQEKMSRRMVIVDKGLYITIAALIAVAMYAYLPRFLKHFSSAKPPVVAMAQAPIRKKPVEVVPSNMVLNGVLLSDQTNVALINNQTYHLGDVVNGMKIVNIQLNSVKLQNESEFVVLRTVS